MSDRLQDIRDAAAMAGPNVENAYADRAWLLHRLDEVEAYAEECRRLLAELMGRPSHDPDAKKGNGREGRWTVLTVRTEWVDRVHAALAKAPQPFDRINDCQVFPECACRAGECEQHPTNPVLAVGHPQPHVAWLRINDYNGARAATIHVCDSDAPGAFKVYRHPVLSQYSLPEGAWVERGEGWVKVHSLRSPKAVTELCSLLAQVRGSDGPEA